jgi:hypothetical protein
MGGGQNPEEYDEEEENSEPEKKSGTLTCEKR